VRARSSPRADLYGKGWRTHVYAAIGSGALHAGLRIVRDAHDTGLRRAIRSELARVRCRLGCRANPLRWAPAHLLEPLRTQLSKPRGVRPFFEHIAMLWIEATGGACGIAEYGGAADDPLQLHHPLWGGFRSVPLFESAEGGGLGLSFEYELATAGIVGLDDIRKPGPGGPALMEPHELRRRWSLVAETKGASEALGRLINAVSQLSLPPSPLRDPGSFLSPVDVDSGHKRLGSNHGSWRGAVAEEETNVRPPVDTGELRCWTARMHSELLGGGVPFWRR
jgi:hypothetical protein